MLITMKFKRDNRVSFYENGIQKFKYSWGRIDSENSATKPSMMKRVGEAFTMAIFSTSDNGRWKNDDGEPWWKRTLDPSSDKVVLWNKIFLVACLVALFVDPLFFYLPQVDKSSEDDISCVTRSLALGGILTFFRTLADLFYFLHVLVRFRTAFVAPSTRVFGKGELVRDKKMIARRYIKSGFFTDLIAALPLPQIVIWFVIPEISINHSRSTYNALQLIVLFQYIARLYLISRLSSEIVKAAGVVTKTAWAGAAYNLLLYMLASHVLGAAWYLLSVERYSSCWKMMCNQEESPIKCHLSYLDCSTLEDVDRVSWANSTQVFLKCEPDDDNRSFDYGIFEKAFEKDVVSTSFIKKYFYCLWWGLQQLSSYGQELEASTYVLETIFCIVMAIMGLVLFAHLIGNMQTYLESLTSRLEEWRIKRRDTEEWMGHRQLPEHLRERVRRFVQYQWLATRGVDDKAILDSLPRDIRRDIQRHLCLDLVRRVPFFAQMDDQLIDAICERLTSSLSTSGTFIVSEGDPVTEMLFIIRGKLDSWTTNGGRSGFFNSITLQPGDFCGEELLAWALLPKATNLPSSTRTVRAINEVEAFALQAEDLKSVANQFRLLHSKKLQHTFRYYSHHWRTWAACFIQAAWRRYDKRKMAQNLISRESPSYENYEDRARDTDLKPITSSQAVQRSGTSTALAKRFPANMRKGQQQSSDEVEFLKLEKPRDPDFFMEQTNYP